MVRAYDGGIVILHIVSSLSETQYAGVPSSYLNTIPISRYRDYCGIDRIYLKPDTEVPVRVKLSTLSKDGSWTVSTSVCDGRLELDISTGEAVVVKFDDNVGGRVIAYPKHLRDVRLAHVVCTYKREDIIKEKMRLFSTMDAERYRMYVVDNGNDIEEQDGPISVIRSINLGGSSGFARGMMEAINNGATHVLLNDDDAAVYPESVNRLIAFLRMVSPEHEEICVTGAMMDADNPCIVYETGTRMDKGRLMPVCRGTDISTTKGIRALAQDEDIEISNWTLFCITAEIIRKKGLPLPLFMREDDVEYGRRIHGRIISIPGISVWHPTYESNYDLSSRYYYMRNRLIALSCTSGLDGVILQNLLDDIGVEIASYRYDCAEAMMDGVMDFLKGPEHAFQLCKTGRYVAPGIQYRTYDELKDKIKEMPFPSYHSYFRRKYSLNGLFRRSSRDVVTSPYDMETSHFYGVCKVLYKIDGNHCFICERKRSRTLSLTVRTVILKLRASIKWKKLVRQYRESVGYYSSTEFWKELLGI